MPPTSNPFSKSDAAFDRRNDGLNGFQWTKSYVGHVLVRESDQRDVARAAHAGDGIWLGTFDFDDSRRIEKLGPLKEVMDFLEVLAGATSHPTD